MDHSATMEKMYERINAHDVDGFSEYLADDFVEHETAPGLAPTREGVRQFFTMYIAGFPDLNFETEDMLASGDKVVARIRVTGTHTGEMMGIPPTGKRIELVSPNIGRIRDGRAVEHWADQSMFQFLQQIGALEQPAAG